MGVRIKGSFKQFTGGFKISTPAETNYSISLDGSDDYVTFPNGSNFAFGTGAFTYEFWVKHASWTGAGDFFVGGRNAIGGGLHITGGGGGYGTEGAIRYVSSSQDFSGTTRIDDNNWHHVAIVRSGTTVSIYIDGTFDASGTDNQNYTATSGTWYLFKHDLIAGGYLQANISNFRIVKGTAVYTSNFTPPSAPLSAIAGTSLLTFNSDTITDTSGNSVSLTASGGPSMVVDGPF